MISHSENLAKNNKIAKCSKVCVYENQSKSCSKFKKTSYFSQFLKDRIKFKWKSVEKSSVLKKFELMSLKVLMTQVTNVSLKNKLTIFLHFIKLCCQATYTCLV